VFCFVFGLAMTLISFAVGSLQGDAGHGDAGHGDVALDHGGAHVGDGPDVGDGDGPPLPCPSPLNVQTGTAFLTFFGGVGYLLYGSAGLGPALALIGATLGGLVGGAVVFLFLARVLVAGQRFVSPESSRLEGAVARVSIPIRPGGTGEIVFDRDGARRSEGARAEQDVEIPVGTEVVVVRYARGIAYVVPWTTYTGEA
jgi:hypothetical protein